MKQNTVLIVLESLRYDQFMSVKPKNMMGIGKVFKAYSAANWTLPSVMSMMTGMLPHSELGQPIRDDFMTMGNIVKEGFWLPSAMQKMDFTTTAMVSIPWLEMINKGWDKFMMSHNYGNIDTMAEIFKKLEHQFFCYFHVGDTHMPYGKKDGEKIVSKKNVNDYNSGKDNIIATHMQEIRSWQKGMLGYVDEKFGVAVNSLPVGTRMIITADHGELFGEDHKFGHGCHFHPKLFEIPLIIGEV